MLYSEIKELIEPQLRKSLTDELYNIRLSINAERVYKSSPSDIIELCANAAHNRDGDVVLTLDYCNNQKQLGLYMDNGKNDREELLLLYIDDIVE